LRKFFALTLLVVLLLILPPGASPAAAQFIAPRTAKGQLVVIVIPVEFTDVTHTESVQLLNDTMSKVSQYYSTASFGQAVVQATVLPNWLLLNHPIAYYGADNNIGDDAAGNPRGSEQLIIDAVSAAQSTTNLSPYRFVIVAHAGADQATASPLEKSSLIWSRTWIGKTFLPAGSDAGSIVSEFSPPCVWAHELGHQTGHLPDMYDLTNSAYHFMGTWSLMDIGAYLGQPIGTEPGLFDAWSRTALGWITPTVVREGDYNLIPAETSPPGGGGQSCCYALEIQIDSSSYYLVELRLREGIDVGQRAEGVLVYLYNASASKGEIRVVDTRQLSMPARNDLSDAALAVGEAFSDTAHNVIITVVSGSSSGYMVHVSSQVSYSISVIVPASVNVLTNEQYSVVLNPPITGLKLQVFLDESRQSIASSNTTATPKYNFTLYLQPAEQGNHNLTADLTDSGGTTLATSTARFTANVPLWFTLTQPTEIFEYVFVAIMIIFIVAVISHYRGRGSGELRPPVG
jgi:M6 family metalloprotease-like protein